MLTVLCCGPRSCSGSSPENVVQVTPLGNTSLRLLGKYSGMKSGGATLKIEDSPTSNMVSRISATV